LARMCEFHETGGRWLKGLDQPNGRSAHRSRTRILYFGTGYRAFGLRVCRSTVRGFQHPGHRRIKIIEDRSIGDFAGLKTYAAIFHHGYRAGHLYPVSQRVVIVVVGLFTYQRTVGPHQGHLTDIALIVVLVSLASGGGRSADWKILILYLGALQIVFRSFQQNSLSVVRQLTVHHHDLDDFRADAAHRTSQPIARAITLLASAWGGLKIVRFRTPIGLAVGDGASGGPG